MVLSLGRELMGTVLTGLARWGQQASIVSVSGPARVASFGPGVLGILGCQGCF